MKTSAKRSWLRFEIARIALLFGLSSCLSPAWGQEPSTVADAGIDINLPIRHDGRTAGVAAVRIYSDNSIALRAESLRTLLGETLTREAIDGLTAAANGSGLLTQEAALNQGFSIRFDPAQLIVDIESPLSARPTLSLQLGRRGLGLDQSQLERPATFSTYLNVYAGYAASENRAGSANVLLESATRLGEVVLETAFTYEGSESDRLERNYVRLVYDDLDQGIRYSAGDILLPSVGFQPAMSMVGVSASRRELFSQLYQGSAAQTSERFVLERAANVEVVVNGAKLQTLRLGPGTYDLSNIPIGATGLNAVELLATDDTGGVQSFRFDRFFDDRLLGVGVIDFGVAAGVPSSVGSFQKPDTKSGVAASAFVLAGVTPALTLGANIGGDETMQVAGLEGIGTTPFGAFAGDIGYSHSRFGEGFGLELDYRAYLPDALKRQEAALDVSVRAYSSDFLLDEPNRRQSTIAEVSARYSQRIATNLYGSVGGYHVTGRGSSPDRTGVHVGLSQTLGAGLNWSTNINYDTDSTGRSDLQAMFTVGVRWNRNTSSRAAHNTRDQRTSVTTNYNSPTVGVGAWSAEIGVERSESSPTALTTAGSYQANRFEVRGQILQGVEALNGERASRAQLLVGSAFAFADGQFAFGRPIRDAFAIVDTHRTLGARDAYIDEQRHSRDYQARKDALGPALVPSLNSHSVRRIGYDVEDLPPGYNLGTGLFIVEPPYRGGYALTIGSDYTVTGMGRIVDSTGYPVSYAVGRIEAIDDPRFEATEFFTNASGRFGIQGLKPNGTYRLHFPSRNTSVQLSVPENAEGMADWKEVKIQERFN